MPSDTTTINGTIILHERDPLLPRELLVTAHSMFALTGASVEEGTRVAGIVQQPQGTRMIEFTPDHLALAWPVTYLSRKREPLFAECLYRAGGRAGATESLEENTDAKIACIARDQLKTMTKHESARLARPIITLPKDPQSTCPSSPGRT